MYYLLRIGAGISRTIKAATKSLGEARDDREASQVNLERR